MRPAASRPRIIGSASSRSPTPRSDHRSWWLRLAAFTVTVAHPSGASGAGRSPTTSPLSGSSKEKVSASTANMLRPLATWRRSRRSASDRPLTAGAALDRLTPMTWTNWVGNQSFSPATTATPRDEDEVVALVKEAAGRGQGVRVAGAGHSFTPVVQTDGLLLDVSAMRGVVGTDRDAQAGDGAARHADPRLLRAALGRRPRAAQPGRHRHPADRRRGGDRDARLRHALHQPVRRRAGRTPRDGHRRGARDRRGRARPAPRRPGLRRDARRRHAARAGGHRRLPAPRARQPPVVGRRDGRLGPARRGAPPLRDVLAADRGVGRALQPRRARRAAPGPVLRQGLRRGRARRARRRHRRAAGWTGATGSSRWSTTPTSTSWSTSWRSTGLPRRSTRCAS